MNWSVLVIAFCVAVIAGSIAATTLARMRPQWSARRQLIAAALVLPTFTLLGTVLGLVAVIVSAPGNGENMQHLALAVIAGIGALFALLAFVAGLIGAGLRQRGMRR